MSSIVLVWLSSYNILTRQLNFDLHSTKCVNLVSSNTMELVPMVVSVNNSSFVSPRSHDPQGPQTII